MAKYQVIYKWASGTGVAMPRGDIHGGNQGTFNIVTASPVEPTRTRVRRGIVANLTVDQAHGSSFAWRIKRKISVQRIA